jgi:hypothetical protein
LTVDAAELKLNAPTQMLADSVTITGTNAKFINEGIFNPSTSLTMTMGGVFENAPGAAFTAVSPLTLSGPFINRGDFNLAAGAPVSLSTANLFQMQGASARIVGPGNLIAAGQTLTLSAGFVDGSPTFDVGLLFNDGATLRPGGLFSIGTITINGNYQQVFVNSMQSGKVQFELAMVGSVDQVVVSGTAALGGDFGRGALGSFAPPVGTVLTVMTAGSIVGSFDSGSELIVFDAPRRYAEQITTTSVALRADATIWVVQSNDDNSMTAPSLRNALTRFNNEGGGGCVNAPYAIHFLLPGGSETTTPTNPLPNISGCPGLLIDGYTQAGASPNNAPGDFNAVLPVVLDGSSCGSCVGIGINAPNTTVRGLRIRDFDKGIAVSATANFAQIFGNHISGGSDGIGIAGANGTQVGGNVAERNVITGAAHGIKVGSSSFVLAAPPVDIVNQRTPAPAGEVDPGTLPQVATSGRLGGGKTPAVPGALQKRGGSGDAIRGVGAPLGTVLIRNNFIGVGPGLAMAGNSAGIFVDDINSVNIDNNVIKYNSIGILVQSASQVDYSVGNVISANTSLGIDLGFDGPTTNDDAAPPYDTDGGANGLLNFPKPLNFTMTTANSGTLNYELKSTPASNFNVCFCRNPSGGIQCELPTACTMVSTDATGSFTGGFALSGLVVGTPVTMLAKALSGPKAGNVSEISPGLNFTTSAPAITVTGSTMFPDTTVGMTSAVQTITLTNTGTGALTIFAIGNGLPAVFFDTVNGPAPQAAHYCGFGSNAMNNPLTGGPIVIPPMGTCQLQMVFQPDTAMMFSGTITVVSDAPTSPTLITLTGTGVAAGAPIFSPSATNFTFPGQVVGTTSAPQTLTVTNTGGSPLVVSAVNSSGPFAIGSNTCSSVAPSMTCAISFTFTPVAAGPAMGNLTITTNATGSPHVIALDGTGLAPATTYAPGSLSFGSLTVGLTSAPQQVTFTNNSPVSLSIVSISLQGGGAGFNVLNTSQCLMSPMVAPMGSCTFDVTATPNAVGALTDHAVVTTSPGHAPTPPNVTLTVTGTAAVVPAMTVAFAPTTVATGVNAALTLTLSNPAAAPVTVAIGSSVSVPGLTLGALSDSCGLGAFAAGASIDLGMGGVIPAMSSCTVTVQVQSATPGSFPVTVNPGNLATSGGSNINSSTATLMVVVASPAVTLSAGALSFGSQTLSTTSPAQTVTLANTGTANLILSSITTTGDFGFTTTCPLLTPPIAPMAAPCNINVTFTPLAVGPRTGTVSIASNAPGSPHLINLSGTGAPVAVPGISLSTATLALGSGVVGAALPQQSVTVSNPGLATLNFTAINVTGAGFARVTPVAASPANCGASLAPMDACQIAVQCVPPSLGVLTGQISIVHNATGSPSLVALNCTGIAAPVATIALPAALDFGDQIINTASVPRPVSIANTGTAAMAVSAVGIAGTDVGDFSVSGSCASVAAGASCPLQVTFTPRATGTRSANLRVTSNAQNAATVNTVALGGTGVLAPRPVVALGATGIGFGNAIFAGATSSQSVTLRNEGGQALAISSIVATGDFIVSHTCGGSLAPQASCAINLLFAPTALGPRFGQLQVFSNAQGSPHAVQLNGTGCRWFAQPNSRFFLTTCG